MSQVEDQVKFCWACQISLWPEGEGIMGRAFDVSQAHRFIVKRTPFC